MWHLLRSRYLSNLVIMLVSWFRPEACSFGAAGALIETLCGTQKPRRRAARKS